MPVMSLGYSVSELIKLTVTAIQIYDTFFDKWKNAPRQLRSLRDELERCRSSLQVQDYILRVIGRDYPGEKAFRDTLDECQSFVDGRQRVIARKNGPETKESIVGVLQNGKFAFERDYAAYLSNELARRRNELMEFNIELILQKIVLGRAEFLDLRSSPFSYGPQVSEPSNATKIEKVLRDLYLIGNESHRIDNAIAQRRDVGGEEKRAELNIRLREAFEDLCDLTGNDKQYLEQLPNVWREADIDASTRSARRIYRRCHTEQNHGVGQIRDGNFGSRSADSASIISVNTQLPPSALNECEVTIRLGQTPVRATSYCIEPAHGVHSRRLIWLDSQQTRLLEHKLPAGPSKCRPYTHHSIHKKPLEVCFLDEQDFALLLSTAAARSRKLAYQFKDESDYKHFLSEVRQRKLQHEFDVNEISSKHARSDKDGHNQRVQLWYGQGDAPQAYLSFFARPDTKLQNYEIPLRWFERALESHKYRSSVKIHFAIEPKEEHRKPSLGLESPSTNKKFPMGLFRRHSSSASTSSSESTTSTSGTLSRRPYASKAWVEKFGYIELLFGNASDRDEFVKAYDDAYTTSVPGSVAATSPAWSSDISNYSLAQTGSGSTVPRSLYSPSLSPTHSRTASVEFVPRSSLLPQLPKLELPGPALTEEFDEG